MLHEEKDRNRQKSDLDLYHKRICVGMGSYILSYLDKLQIAESLTKIAVDICLLLHRQQESLSVIWKYSLIFYN